MSRQANEPPSVEKPGLIATKETSSNNNNNTNTNLYPNLNPPSYSQATYASVPPYSSTGQPTTAATPPPAAAPQYIPANQNVIVVQGPAAYYANPRAMRLPDGSTPCVQCGTIYPMPAGATSFRCRQCGKFNNTNRDQCIIL